MKRFRWKILIAIILLLGLWLFFDLTARIVTDFLWFKEVDYLSVLLKKWRTQFVLGTVTAGIC